MTIMTDGPVYNTLSELIRSSEGVVMAKVIGVSPSYLLPFIHAQTSQPESTPAALNSIATQKMQMAQAAPTHIPVSVPLTALAHGVLKTEVTVEVLQVFRGSSLQVGQLLTVVQTGGIDGQGNQEENENDPLLRVGGAEIMFLHRATTGKFYATGDGQGRFAVTPTNTVVARNGEEPVGLTYNGKPASTLIAAIAASAATPANQ